MSLYYFLILCLFLTCVGLEQDEVGLAHDDIGVVTCPCDTELEDVMCAAQCQAQCYSQTQINCSSACEPVRVSSLEHSSWKWWCSCSDPTGYSEWCILYGRPKGYIPPPPDLVITRDPLTRKIQLEWTADPRTDPNVVYVVIQIDQEEKFITMLDLVKGVNTYNVTGSQGHCDRPYFCLAAVSSFGSRGLIRPVRTPALVPGSPRDLNMTSVNVTSYDSEFLHYTMVWVASLGWSAHELEHDLTYESQCPPGPDLDSVVVFHYTPVKVKDPNGDNAKGEDIFQMSGKIPTYAIGCNITFKVSAMSTCMGANVIPSNPAVYTYILRCEDFPSYAESHCEQPEDLEPGPVRDVKLTTVHYDDQVLVLVSWLPPDNLDASRQLDHYQVYWGVVVVSPVIMDFEVMLGNSSLHKTEFGLDIEVNATTMTSRETVGVVVETLAPGQILSQPRAAIYIHTVTSTPQFRHGKLLTDDGIVIVVQNMFPEELDPPTSNDDLSRMGEGTPLKSTYKNSISGTSFYTTFSPPDDPLVSEPSTAVKETSTKLQEPPTPSSEMPRTKLETPTTSRETPSTAADIQVVVYWRRRHWLMDSSASGYLVQWGRFGADLHDNNRTQNKSVTLQEEEVHSQFLTEESLLLRHLQRNTTYWIKVRPTVNSSEDVVSKDEWDNVDLHAFTTLDVNETHISYVTPFIVPSSENPPPAYHTNGTDVMATSVKPSPIEQDDGRVLPMSVTATIVVVAVLVTVFVGSLFWCSWKRRRQPSLTFVSPSEYRPYSYFIPGKTLSSMRNSQCPMVADEWELPISCVKLGPTLGSGAFGKVVKGRITRAMLTHRGVASLLADYGACLQEGDSLHATVAIKMLQEDCDVIYKQDFLKEIQLMKKIGYHDNIVSMLGCCTLRDPVCLVVEHVGQGDLLNYLKYIRHKLHNLPAESPHYVNKGVEILDPVDLVRFAWHITRGMEFLASKGFVHRDLAARNVLVGNNKVCKIGDFGLARYVYDNTVYVNRRGGRLPVKWMSVEAIFDMTFSTASDVWSFGIVLFEIVTLGGTPYPTIPTRDLLRELQRGYRMERPENCSQEIYNIMRQCWHQDPASRPSFGSLSHWLENLLSDESRVSYFDMGMHLGQHLYIDDEECGHKEMTSAQPENLDTPSTSRPSNLGVSQDPVPTLSSAFQDLAAVYPPSLSEDSGYVSQQKMSVSSGDSSSVPTCQSDDGCPHPLRDPDDKSPSSISLTTSCPDMESVVDDVFEGETLPRKLSLIPALPLNHFNKAMRSSLNSLRENVIPAERNRNRRHSLTDNCPMSSDETLPHSACTHLRRSRSESDCKNPFNLRSITWQQLQIQKPSFYRKVSKGSEKSRWAKRYMGARQRRNAVVVPPTFAMDNELYRLINQVVPPAVQIVRKFKATKMEVVRVNERGTGYKRYQNTNKDVFLNFADFSKRSKENKSIRKAFKANSYLEIENTMTPRTAEVHLWPEVDKKTILHSPSEFRRPFKSAGNIESLDDLLTERHLNGHVMCGPGQLPGLDISLPLVETKKISQRGLAIADQGGPASAHQGGPASVHQGGPVSALQEIQNSALQVGSTSTPKSKRTFIKTPMTHAKTNCPEMSPSLKNNAEKNTLKWPPFKHDYHDFKNILCHCASQCQNDAHSSDIGKRARFISLANKPRVCSNQCHPICRRECLIPKKEVHAEEVRTIIPGQDRTMTKPTSAHCKSFEILCSQSRYGLQGSAFGCGSKEEAIDKWCYKRTPSWEDLSSPEVVTSHKRRSSDPVYLKMVSPEWSPRGSLISYAPLTTDDVHSDPSPPMNHSARCFWFPSPRKRRFGVAEDPGFETQPKTNFPNEKHPSALYLVTNSSDRDLQVSENLDQDLQMSSSVDEGLQVTNSSNQDVHVFSSHHEHHSKSLTIC